MSNSPAVSGKELVKFLENRGWMVVRVKGSHHVMKRDGFANLLTVPVHSNKPLKKGTLNAILKAASATVDDL